MEPRRPAVDIHDIPNRSTTMPKRSAQNVFSSRIQSAAGAERLEDALGVSDVGEVNREREPLGAS
jgi:hypothetical protein